MSAEPAKNQEVLPLRRHLRLLKDTVDFVFDIGVRRGTPDLYVAFGQKKFLLVDPQRDGEELLLSKPRNYEFLNIGLGSKRGQLEFNEDKAKSSFMKRSALTESGVSDKRLVDIDTLDNVIRDKQITGRIGLKIDTEGYELEVLAGLQEFVGQVEFIICEATIRRRFENSYTFSELVCACREKGFEFYTFIGAAKLRPRFYDVIFLRKDHPLFD